MDFHSNLEYLCRVCAGNTKGKNSVAECAYILKTPGLKDKLDKFLYLKIADNDALPKVLCKSCFRQVEATASLSKIAKHTQQVFRDFLLSNLPKSSSNPVNTSELISSDFLGNNYSEKSQNDPTLPPAPANSLAQLPIPVARKDEVIVNVSVADPLTRDNQLKMISNSQRRQSLQVEPPPRYTPKSIAQLPMAPPRYVSAKTQTVEVATPPTSVPIINNQNSTMPINYSPVKPQQQPTQQQQQQPQPKQQLPAQITTFSSGGYVIGRLNTGPSDKKEAKKTTLPLAPAADNVLQQKRKNLVKALNNIKANNSGQVSLLKSSQPKQTPITQPLTKTPLAEVVNQAAEDELPEKIIIAAPKKKSPEKSKKEPLNLSSKLVKPKIPPTNPTTVNAVVVSQDKPVTYNPPPPPPPPPAPAAPKSTFPEDILLGRVIRDMDLLKLILKALQWPVSKQNMDAQIQRLKNSKFTDIMSDSNLLQDTDLTQLLGPYLAPVLLAAQALQQQQHALLQNTTLNHNMSAAYITQKSPPTVDSQAQVEINTTMPYKLPPETSVQLVPATPEEQEASSSPPLPLTSTSTAFKRSRQKEEKPATDEPPKRQRRAAAQKARDSIVISDEDDEDDKPLKKPVRHRTPKSNSSNVQQQLNNNNIMSQLGMLSGSGGDEANEALLALLNRQKEAISKQQKLSRRRRNSISNMITLPASEFDALIDLNDDIVLMEPVSTTSGSISASESLTSSLGQTQQQHNDLDTFVVPTTVALITRPIIKRRKTVIQTSRGRSNLGIDLNANESNGNKEKQNTEQSNQIAPQIILNMENQQQNQEHLKAATNAATYVNPSPSYTVAVHPKLPTSSSSLTQQKKLQNKAALGQQLLEAIGLQQTVTNLNQNSTQNETASSSTALITNNKQSIQQIRSALKKSLKQAQEQQRKKEITSTAKSNTTANTTTTIIQDADSTTKPSVKEIVVVEGKGNKTDNCSSSLVDVEDQIDKVTLMVRKNDKTTLESTDTVTDKGDKKEEKKLSQLKLTESRSTITGTAVVRNARSLLLDDAKLERSLNTVEDMSDPKILVVIDNDKSDKEDTEVLNISSSSAATLPISIADSLTSSEINPTKAEEAPTPKRRGRKRLVDKEAEMKAIEREKELAKESESLGTVEKSKDDDEDDITINNLKTDGEKPSNRKPGRPTRQSKAQSKYYKGPDQTKQGRRSLPSRSTRNRKYS